MSELTAKKRFPAYLWSDNTTSLYLQRGVGPYLTWTKTARRVSTLMPASYKNIKYAPTVGQEQRERLPATPEADYWCRVKPTHHNRLWLEFRVQVEGR